MAPPKGRSASARGTVLLAGFPLRFARALVARGRQRAKGTKGTVLLAEIESETRAVPMPRVPKGRCQGDAKGTVLPAKTESETEVFALSHFYYFFWYRRSATLYHATRGTVPLVVGRGQGNRPLGSCRPLGNLCPAWPEEPSLWLDLWLEPARRTVPLVGLFSAKRTVPLVPLAFV